MNPESDPLIGRRLEGRYRVDRHLADGGMGRVYIAHDERLARDVALKVLRQDLARDPAFVARFRREAQSAARLANPHVVSVHDQGADGPYIFLAMELVRGHTLRDLLRTPGVTYHERLRIFDQMLLGLAAAHAEGLAHRDIKPENVLIDTTGHVKVADFGLARAIAASARVSDSDVLLGTASYLSPEQVEHGYADTRSDVYACGLVLYEILAGRRAFEGPAPINVAYRHVHEDVPALDQGLPGAPEANALIAAACARNPAARPADAHELRSAFRHFVARTDPAAFAAYAPVLPSGDAHSHLATESHTAVIPHGATHVIHRTGLASSPANIRRRAAALAAAALALLLLAWLFLLGPFGLRSVPDVHGKPQGQAIQELRDAGFDVAVHRTEDDNVRAGQAIGTAPHAGAHRWPFGSITLDMSLGPRMVTVPATRGVSESDARARLTQSGLRVSKTQQVYSTVPAGSVVATSPSAGARLRHDSDVTLQVSKGPAPVVVPDLTRQPADQAIAQLKNLGLTANVTQSSSQDVPKEAIVSTNPTPGTTLHTGDAISLVVSSGPEMVAVPDVTGHSAGDARSMLESAGFSVDGVNWFDEVLNRTVVSQTPSGGNNAQAPKGSTVTLGF